MKILILPPLFLVLIVISLAGIDIIDRYDLGGGIVFGASGETLPLSANEYWTYHGHRLWDYRVENSIVTIIHSMIWDYPLENDIRNEGRLRYIGWNRGYVGFLLDQQGFHEILRIELDLPVNADCQTLFKGLAGNNLFVTYYVAPQGGAEPYYLWQIYDISDITTPVLLAQRQFQTTRDIHNVFSHQGYFYFIEYLPQVTYCSNLVNCDPQPALIDWPTDEFIHSAFLAEDYLLLFTRDSSGGHIRVCGFQPDGMLTIVQTYDIMITDYTSMYIDDDGLIYFAGVDTANNWRTRIIKCVLADNGNLEILDTSSFQDVSQCQIVPNEQEFVLVAKNSLRKMGADLTIEEPFYNSVCYISENIALGRYLLLSSYQDLAWLSQFMIYDLVESRFLDYQRIAYPSISYRYPANTFRLFPADDCVDIVRMNSSGIEWIEEIQSEVFDQMDVYQDILVFGNTMDNHTDYTCYRYGNEQLTYIAGFNYDGQAWGVRLVDENHLAIQVSNNVRYYRILEDGSFNYMAEFPNCSTDAITQNAILSTSPNQGIIDIREPDNPYLAGEWYSPYANAIECRISSNTNGYLITDEQTRLCVYDSSYTFLDSWVDNRAFFLSDNRIVICDDSSLLIASLPYVSGISDDPAQERLPGFLSVYPNPFNPTTTIAFDITRPGQVTLNVYNLRGQKVTTLLDEPLTPGRRQAVWNGTDAHGRPVASGMYFARLRTTDGTMVRKMLMMK